MFSRSGKQLVWGSSRNATIYELNLFIADWVDDVQAEDDEQERMRQIETNRVLTKRTPQEETEKVAYLSL